MYLSKHIISKNNITRYSQRLKSYRICSGKHFLWSQLLLDNLMIFGAIKSLRALPTMMLRKNACVNSSRMIKVCKYNAGDSHKVESNCWNRKIARFLTFSNNSLRLIHSTQSSTTQHAQVQFSISTYLNFIHLSGSNMTKKFLFLLTL